MKCIIRSHHNPNLYFNNDIYKIMSIHDEIELSLQCLHFGTNNRTFQKMKFTFYASNQVWMNTIERKNPNYVENKISIRWVINHKKFREFMLQTVFNITSIWSKASGRPFWHRSSDNGFHSLWSCVSLHIVCT